MRRALFLLATWCTWFFLLAWAAGVHWNWPWQPAARNVLAGRDFRAVVANAAVDGTRLRIDALGADGTALQSQKFAGIAATDYPVLRYRFRHFPRTLELALVFRRADAPNDVQSVTLPWPGRGMASFNLRDLPAWRGTITEIGFAEYATPQLIPADFPFRPFEIAEAQLWSRSWRGAFAALATDWFGYRPWGLFAVSSVALEAGPNAPRRPPLILAVAGAMLALVGWGALLLGWRSRALGAALVCAGAIGWLSLDLPWLGQLAGRLATTRAVYAGKPWDQRERLVPDADVLVAADRVRELAARVAPAAKVLVWSDSDYVAARLSYQLLPLNLSLFVPVHLATRDHIPGGTLLVLYGDTGNWRYDPVTGALTYPGLTLHADALLVAGELLVYRIRAEQGA